MKRYIRKKNPKFYKIAAIIVVSLLTMSIGYSLSRDSLHIKGSANIKPIISLTSYTIYFNENGGEGTMQSQTIEYGVSEKLSKNLFQKQDYSFVEWNTKPDGTGTSYTDTQVVSNLGEAGDNVILYAIWDRYQYINNDTIVFDGTNYIDTDVKLFSARNYDKDFTVKFTINSKDADQVAQAVLFCNMNESGKPYTGTVTRVENGIIKEVSNVNNQTNGVTLEYSEGMEVVLKRDAGVLSYSIDGGKTYNQAANYNNAKLPFDAPATFGAGLDGNLNPFRYFKGTLSNLYIKIAEIEKYIIEYNSNGGNGIMENQVAILGRNETIASNEFTKEGLLFDCWNTEPDGSGQDYEAGQIVNNIAEAGETITLYAKWKEPHHYTVTFHKNVADDETTTQEFVEGVSQTLNANMFTNGGATFIKWNTKANKTGKDYSDQENVVTLTKTEDNIDLYAVWAEEVYTYNGEIEFTGTNNLNTGLQLFNAENNEKDFEVSFEILSRVSTSGQATIMSAMDETGAPWPGMVYRIKSGSQEEFGVNANNSKKATKNFNTNSTNKVTIKRINGIIYISTNDGESTQVLDMSSLSKTFDSPLVFGSSIDGSGNPMRYFTGTLANIKAYIYQ